MSTNNGVASFDVRRKLFKSYSSADGLPGLDLTGWGACVKSPSGEMFFGGFAGATSFYPDKVQEGLSVPPIVLTDLRVFGTSVAVGGNSILKRAINYTDSIRLTDKQDVFSVQFSALSFANPVTNRYRYMLEGLDPQWNEVGGDQRLASYTTLSAGIYKFHVEGATSHGPWTKPGRELTIEILPPWWLTPWFRALSVFIVLILLWMLYQLRLKQLERQFNMALEVRINERTQIARELHDTLLQSFQGAVFQFQAARKLLLRNANNAMQVVDDAIQAAEEGITEGRAAIHDLRPEPATQRDLPELLKATGRELADAHGLNGHAPIYEVVVEGKQQDLSPMLQDEVYRISREVIRNAFAHAAASHIEVEIRYDQDQLRVRIRDDGKGIDPKILEDGGQPGHWGISGMRERAQRIGARLVFMERDRRGN